MSINNVNTQKSLEKLSSGLRINKAGDDAAGLAISEKRRGQIRGLDQAARNAQDSISLINTAEGSLAESHSILQRMRELATQGANDTNTTNDRTEIQKELNALTTEINRIGNTTEFNTKKLLNGDISATAQTLGTSNFAADTTQIASVSLAKGATLAAGNYTIDVATNNTTTKNLVNATTDTQVTNIAVASNSTLSEGSYNISIAKSSTVASIGSSTLQSAVTDLTLDSTSSLTGAHTITTKRVDTAGAVSANGSGLGNIAITTPGTGLAEGSYSVVTSATASTLGAGSVLAAGFGSLAVTTANGANPAGMAAGAYTIDFQETDTNSGIFTAQIMNGATEVSEKVVLDNNVQNYKFYVKGGSGLPADELGLEFNTTVGVNTALGAQGVDETAPKNNNFTIDTHLDLKLGSNVLASDTIAGDVVGATTASFTVGTTVLTQDIADAALLVGNKSATFNVTSALQAKLDSGSYQNITAGSTVNLGSGVTFTAGALSDFDASGTGEQVSDFGVSSQDVYKATLKSGNNGSGGVVPNTQEVVVSSSGTFNFGNGVTFTTGAGAIVAGSNNFEVGSSTTPTTTDVLTKTGPGGGAVTTLDITDKANTTIDFGSGLTANISGLTAGQASFDVANTTTDAPLTMQIGANKGQLMSIDMKDMRANALLLTGTAGTSASVSGAVFTSANGVGDGTNSATTEAALDVSTTAKATAAIEVIDNAINLVSAERSKLGAFTNRLEHTIANLGTTSENMTSAESRVRDVDMAKEMMQFQKNNILSQAAQAMLAQANKAPQGVLQLLR